MISENSSCPLEKQLIRRAHLCCTTVVFLASPRSLTHFVPPTLTLTHLQLSRLHLQYALDLDSTFKVTRVRLKRRGSSASKPRFTLSGDCCIIESRPCVIRFPVQCCGCQCLQGRELFLPQRRNYVPSPRVADGAADLPRTRGLDRGPALRDAAPRDEVARAAPPPRRRSDSGPVPIGVCVCVCVCVCLCVCETLSTIAQ